MTGRDIKEALERIIGGDQVDCEAAQQLRLAIPDDAILVTQETLARALRKAYPSSTLDRHPSRTTLTAATILAALADEEPRS